LKSDIINATIMVNKNDPYEDLYPSSKPMKLPVRVLLARRLRNKALIVGQKPTAKP
jgi:hypothetical protein